MPRYTKTKLEPSLKPCSRLKLTALQIANEPRFASLNIAGGTTFVRTSRVARQGESLIRGVSMSSSIVRLPRCDQICSYSPRTSSSVGWGDQLTSVWITYDISASIGRPIRQKKKCEENTSKF